MVRKAHEGDIEAILALINDNLDKLLKRERADIVELIETLWVAEVDGEIVGSCCLEVYSPKIAEIRSLAVREDKRGFGFGHELVATAVAEAQSRHIKQILVVTSSPRWFEDMGFGQCLNEKYALFWTGK